MTPFRSPTFRLLWGSGLTFMAAQGMERTATAWLALHVGGGAFAVGLIFAARMLPSLLFGLVAGTIADRAERTRQLVAVAGAAVLLMAGLSWLIAAGGMQTWHVLAFSFAAGCVQVFAIPARQALVLDTVPREVATRALALSALGARFAGALGALAGGLLIAGVGAANCYLAVAALYGLTAALSAILRVPQVHRESGAPPPFRQAIGGALRLMVDLPAIRTLTLAGVACEIFAFSHMSALPPFAQDVLATGAEGLGTMNAALSIGGAAAVTILSLLPEAGRRQPYLAATFLLYGVALVALSATRGLLAASAALLVIGFCAAAFDVLQQTLIQLAVPDAQRGRAMGIWIFSVGSAPLGLMEMGALTAALGSPAALAINGGLTLAAAGLLLARAPAYRWARGPAPSEG